MNLNMITILYGLHMLFPTLTIIISFRFLNKLSLNLPGENINTDAENIEGNYSDYLRIGTL